MKTAKDMTIAELFATVDPLYVRWKDGANIVHAVGQSVKGSRTFCDVTFFSTIFQSEVADPVTCIECIANAEERGILP